MENINQYLMRLIYILELLISLLFLFPCSCRNSPKDDDVLVNKNRYTQIMEDISKHYFSDHDSLKLQAGLFLIKNLKDKNSFSGIQYSIYLRFIDSLTDRKMSPLEYKHAILDYYKQFGTLVGGKDEVNDLKNITSEYLIQNIDESFKAWENSPWGKRICFRDFCEYILPYRIGTEPLENFRKNLYDKFKFIYKDSSISIRAAADSVLAITSKKEFELMTYPDDVPDYSISRLRKLKAGSCRDISCLSTFIMRSVGIPVANDFTPQWPNRGLGHDWNALVEAGDSCIDFEGASSTKVGGHLKSLKSWIIAKAYRHMFSKQDSSLAIIHGTEPIPEFFMNAYLRDVSLSYIKGDTISLVIDQKTEIQNKYAYLCVFNNESWVPIQWAAIKNSKVRFTGLGKPVIYLPVLYFDQGIKPINQPILLDSNGVIHFIVADTSKLRTVHLKRKYPTFDWWNTRTTALKNGCFQLSDHADFKNSKTIYRIREIPGMMYQTIKIHINKPYKYFRYLSPDSSYGVIAEIVAYNKKGKKIEGTVVSTESDGLNTAQMAFDSNTLSYFQGKMPNNNWVGMVFKKTEVISKVKFLCQNDDNFIRTGELYELYYWWNNDWKSLGRQIGKETQDLIFNNVPQQALLLLRNHSKGKEERIFTYERGKQIWW